MYTSKEQSKRGFQIPLDIIAEASRQGITLEQLQEMVAHSTRITHPEGNRRYHDYLFMVEGGRVIAFGKLEPVYVCEQCKDTHVVQTFDECGACDGVGCEKCDQGLVPSTIPCPVCALRKAGLTIAPKL